jgi:hypothetical protein
MKARDNPLATHRVLSVRYRPLDVTWSQLLARLERMNYRAAIVGPKGTGKTTLIEDLAPHLAARGLTPHLFYLTEDQRDLDLCRIRHLTERDVILLDGAEQLNALRWTLFRIASRDARGLIVTQHCPGRFPTLLHTSTTPDLLHEIASRLLGAQSPTPQRIGRLFDTHRGNLREALRELYDDFAASAC